MDRIKRFMAALWYVLTLRCEEADHLRAAPDPGDLPWYERLAERLHRISCASCRRARRQLKYLGEIVSRVDLDESTRQDVVLSPEARVRIAEVLRRGRSQ